MTELPRRLWLCNRLWPLVPDVMEWHLCWGQLITKFHRWIHGCSNQTRGAVMLERHYNIRRHMVKTEHTHTVRQTGDVRGQQAWQDWKTVNSSTVRIVRVSHKLFQCYQWINSQEITPECNVFFSNSHERLVTSLRGSAQILQQTEQCCAILGYIRLTVLEYASY